MASQSACACALLGRAALPAVSASFGSEPRRANRCRPVLHFCACGLHFPEVSVFRVSFSRELSSAGAWRTVSAVGAGVCPFLDWVIKFGEPEKCEITTDPEEIQ
ncbi:uncharacterized protein LOC104867524 isoform X3 [Fukomys damarensis]|uniref:uncharacterized protein LOC104867524 isoform X3 n=1 Tax=Fukomys damarensis TaxID=885580 RepID=UPI0005400A62|nr:uncharacterized protein LOC104867524 isoform X3 [Fukomys damarensis]